MNASIALAGRSAAPVVGAAQVSAGAVFLRETRSEFLRLLRAPSFCVPTIAFPLMFYALFGILLAGGHAHPEAARHAFASFVVLGTMAPGLFALGITLAADRDRGLLELKRALPMPRGIYIGAKMVMAMLFAVLVSVLLMALAVSAGGLTLSLPRLALYLLLAPLGALPFGALGLLVGALARASAAPSILNVIYLPMSFLSGLWLPLHLLPHVLGQIAPLWPSWQLAQIAAAIAGDAPRATIGPHVLVLALWTAVCAAGAWRALARAR